MESHLHEWLNLLVRWIHMITGVAWIGASFYFNWLENRLNRAAPQEPGIAGHLWAVHGGGFYYLKKFQVAPETLPKELHWFKWEAYMTWVSGMSLLAVVYYFNSRALLIDPAVMDISPVAAVMIGITSVVLSWVVYDILCNSELKEKPLMLALVLLGYITLLAWGLSQLFSGRGAFIHVGAAIGTMMVGNVFFVIIPAQKELVAALVDGREPDPNAGKSGLLRSRHNNYLTLPVLFIMISNHFPSTYGHEWNWVVLLVVSLISVAVRHYFNIRHLDGKKIWILPVAFFAMVLLAMATAPPAPEPVNEAEKISYQGIKPVIEQRCLPCHAEQPNFAGFSAPPQGLVLSTQAQLENNAAKVHALSVVQRSMPPGNLTQLTEAERDMIDRWYRSLLSDNGAF